MRYKSMASVGTALLAVSLLAGCTSGGKPDPGPTGQVQEKDDGDKGKDKVEISFWYGWGGPEEQVIKSLIDKFNASQDRIIVKGTLEADYSKQLTAITAGSPPDVASQFGNNSVPYGVDGAMTPLDDYMKKSGITAADFVTGALEQNQYEGVTYALPVAMHISMLLYNKDILAEAGYDQPPETVQQLAEYFDKLNKIEAGGEIKRLAFNPNLPIYDFTYLFGGKFYDEEKQEITPQDPGFLAAMKYNANLWKKAGGSEKLSPFFNSLGAVNTADDPFFTGKYAMMVAGEWVPSFIKRFAPPNFNYGIAPLPYDEKHPDKKGSASVSTSTFYIPKGAKHPDEAWEFIRWFLEPENTAEFNAGIGNLPPVLKAIDQDVFEGVPGFKEYLEASKNPNLFSFPSMPYTPQYRNEIGVAYTEVLDGKLTPEVAGKQIADKMKPVLEKYAK
ncbi:Putative ABC transporter substrate-binding protein yesO [Chlamydia abortus]|uniref:ABC transporter substrate-binding protein n=1 Tax=Paenibacillus residui TaxID=629724 RepID=A0ABW3D8M8_9BACL|nr:ABC transporter substrate-binding protein [Paenibacillus sp. 32O-W]SHE13851.1 Putative ABC transporter substrate-binding protein yesO [Chlamydia abortus]